MQPSPGHASKFPKRGTPADRCRSELLRRFRGNVLTRRQSGTIRTRAALQVLVDALIGTATACCRQLLVKAVLPEQRVKFVELLLGQRHIPLDEVLAQVLERNHRFTVLDEQQAVRDTLIERGTHGRVLRCRAAAHTPLHPSAKAL